MYHLYGYAHAAILVFAYAHLAHAARLMASYAFR